MFSYHLFCTNYDYCRKFVDYLRNCRFSLKLYKKQKKQPTEVFCKKRYSQKFLKIHRKHLCQSTFFNKVADLACNFVKKILWHSCFPVNFAKFLRTPTFFAELIWATASDWFCLLYSVIHQYYFSYIFNEDFG